MQFTWRTETEGFNEKGHGWNSAKLTLASLPSLAFLPASVVPQVSFIPPCPSVPAADRLHIRIKLIDGRNDASSQREILRRHALHSSDANLVTPRNCDVRCPNVCAGLRATGIGAGSSCGGSAGTSATDSDSAADRSGGTYIASRSHDLMPEMDIDPPTTHPPPPPLYTGIDGIALGFAGVPKKYSPWWDRN